MTSTSWQLVSICWHFSCIEILITYVSKQDQILLWYWSKIDYSITLIFISLRFSQSTFAQQHPHCDQILFFSRHHLLFSNCSLFVLSWSLLYNIDTLAKPCPHDSCQTITIRKDAPTGPTLILPSGVMNSSSPSSRRLGSWMDFCWTIDYCVEEECFEVPFEWRSFAIILEYNLQWYK